MKIVGYMFESSVVEKYKLMPKDCTLLNWFIFFLDSKNMGYIDRPDGRYYWVPYKKIMDEFGGIRDFRSVSRVRNIINKLVEKGLLSKLSGRTYGSRSYYKLKPNIKEEFKAQDIWR